MRVLDVSDRRIRQASLLLAGVCLLVVGLTATALRLAVSDPDGRTGYVVGDRVDLPADWFEGTDDTLLVFLRSDCAASQAFAVLLPELRSRIPDRVQVLAVVSDASPAREASFAESAGFERTAVRMADFESLQLRVVPTLVLVDRHGQVKAERLGTSLGAGRVDLLAELSGLVTGS